MTIQEYAKKHGHKIVGELTRRPDWEYDPHKDRAYEDEAGNEYHIAARGCCIITTSGEVI